MYSAFDFTPAAIGPDAAEQDATRWLTLRLECIRRLAGDAGCAIVAGERDCLRGSGAGHQPGAGSGPGVGIASAAGVAGGGATGADCRFARLCRCLFLGRALQAAQPGHLAAFITVALGVPLVVAMILLVVAEALVPSGMVPQPLEVIRGTRQAVARSRRYGQISRIAVRHGLGPYLRGRGLRRGDAAGGRAALAQSLRRALEEGGVTFTKLGQLLSTRRDLLPEEFISELAQLQDRAGPAPWEQGEKVIAESRRG